jgi:hypothetical protein
LPDAKLDKPIFPWNFLADPNGPDRELAANWIFLHLRGKAYQGYLEAGRGVLLGPFLSDESDTAISSEDAAHRHASGQVVGLAVMYLPVQAQFFAEMLPDEVLRASICEAVNEYDPVTQCVVLLRHDDSAVLTRIIGVPDDSSGIHTPRAAFYRDFLEHSMGEAGRVN